MNEIYFNCNYSNPQILGAISVVREVIFSELFYAMDKAARKGNASNELNERIDNLQVALNELRRLEDEIERKKG